MALAAPCVYLGLEQPKGEMGNFIALMGLGAALVLFAASRTIGQDMRARAAGEQP